MPASITFVKAKVSGLEKSQSEKDNMTAKTGMAEYSRQSQGLKNVFSFNILIQKWIFMLGPRAG